jgi:phenylpyruvate tautomerase
MPLLTVYTSRPHPADAAAMLKSLSALVAQELRRSESYVMTMLVADVAMTFAGTSEPACYAELKSIGEFSSQGTLRRSAVLSSALSEKLGVPKDRTYIEFANPPGHLWGHDGGTFE